VEDFKPAQYGAENCTTKVFDSEMKNRRFVSNKSRKPEKINHRTQGFLTFIRRGLSCKLNDVYLEYICKIILTEVVKPPRLAASC